MPINLSLGLANTLVLKFEAGWNFGINLYGTNKVIIFFESLISTTQTRSAGSSIFSFLINNKYINIDVPYNFTGIMYQNNNNSNTFFGRVEAAKQYIGNSVAWNANTNVRVFGSFIGTIQS